MWEYAFCRVHLTHLSRMAELSTSCAHVWTKHRQCTWRLVCPIPGGNFQFCTLCMCTIGHLCTALVGAQPLRHYMVCNLKSLICESLGVVHMCTYLRIDK